ncbi:hypothetical protein [Pedobacter frigidisoli]|uniref:hypothetical protein n=1 Tax=Pedobacter frigidisoli TaxID=2530455 RepID=UPI00292FC48B|nr:hypothetical protein [Pedobacter frigidisoli]
MGFAAVAMIVGGSAFTGTKSVNSKASLATRTFVFDQDQNAWVVLSGTYDPNKCIEGDEQCSYITTNDAVPNPLSKANRDTYIGSLTAQGASEASYDL